MSEDDIQRRDVVVPPTADLLPNRIPGDLLDQLAAIIGEAQQTPRNGADASAAMRAGFERAAQDIERVGQEHLARAEAMMQEALSFSSIVRRAGDVLCSRIEVEAARGYKISKAMHVTRQMVEETSQEAPEPPQDTHPGASTA